MSPASSRRSSDRNTPSRPAVTSEAVIPGQVQCDCPACSGEEFDPQQLIDDLLADADELVTSADPLEAEVAGSALLAIGEAVGDQFEEALLAGFIPQFESRATAGALAMLLGIGAVSGDRAAKAASAAVERLIAAGVTRPAWMDELADPVTVSDCWHLSDSFGNMSILVCRFHRGGRSHAFFVGVANVESGSADQIYLFDADDIPAALASIRAGTKAQGIELSQENMDPAEFRWRVENALEARAANDGYQPAAEPDDEIGPDYPTLSVLLRTRLKTLPAIRPGEPARIYQIKVGLRGAKPPIWRRLEVPADVTLAELHDILQVAFEWDDSHLHVFETPYGQFGVPDPELNHDPEGTVALERVAPNANSKLTYLYDFGDNWQHDIVVEKVFDRDPAVTYPRCTGGRRAAPPEDCGGVWGYTDLVEIILADPTHPEHREWKERLGLDEAADLALARFDPAKVTRALSSIR